MRRAVRLRVFAGARRVVTATAAVALAVALAASACAPQRVGSGVEGAVVADAADAVRADLAKPRTPEPAPTPRPVTRKASELVLPADLVQQPSVATSIDEAWTTLGWHRQFVTTDYFYLNVYIIVSPPNANAVAGLGRRVCDLRWSGSGPSTVGEVPAEALGDGAKACLYHFEGNVVDWVQVVTATRNVTVDVSLEPRAIMSTEAAVARAVDYARRQLDIIATFSPP